jgi:hypothetical protein
MRFLFAILLTSTTALAQSPPSIPPTGNFVYIDQIGDNNYISVMQTNSDRNRTAVINQGDGNLLSITQSGPGQHTSSITTLTPATNNNNILSIDQSGVGNHMASILLNNATGASNNAASISQSGGTGANKQFTLELKGSQIGVNVVQDNPTTPDSSTMSIHCLTPPCLGYSYTKH